jgi:hypothetical protein
MLMGGQVVLAALVISCLAALFPSEISLKYAKRIDLNLLVPLLFLVGLFLASLALSLLGFTLNRENYPWIGQTHIVLSSFIAGLLFLVLAKALNVKRETYFFLPANLFLAVGVYAILELAIRNGMAPALKENYYDTFIGSSTASEQGASTFGLRRFLGPFGFHPSTSVCFLVVLGIILDSLKGTMRFRIGAICISLFSFSGSSYLYVIGAILSLTLHIWQSTQWSGRAKNTLIAIILVTAVLLFYFTKDKLSAFYVALVSSLKVNQIMDYMKLDLSLSEFISGITPQTIKFDVIGHSPYYKSFGSSDFGLVFILVSGGLAGVISLGARIFVLTRLIMRTVKSSHDTIILAFILLATNFHYSIFNVVNASLALTLGVVSAYCFQNQSGEQPEHS